MTTLGNFLYHYLGLQGIGPWYAWWSGFFADIIIFTAAGSIWYHHTCHAQPWYHLSWGKSVDGTTYRLCHKHHPDHEGNKRSVPLDTILAAHQDHEETS